MASNNHAASRAQPISPAIDPAFEHYLRDIPGLTYASSDQGWIYRTITNTVEVLLGRRAIERHYFALKDQALASSDFFPAALARSGITLTGNLTPLGHIPSDRPVMFVANHPFGVVDGLILCNLAQQLRGDFRVVINSLLCQDRSLAGHFYPIDFSGTRAAERRNVRAKQLAGNALAQGIPLVLFPSGMVSTASHFGFGPVNDAPWTTFVAKLAIKHQPVIVPVYFHGQNTRAFHIASHIAEPLRMAMLMREALKLFNTPVKLVVGKPLLPHEYPLEDGRKALTQYLYRAVQQLKTEL